jgi:hypothetical protein
LGGRLIRKQGDTREKWEFSHPPNLANPADVGRTRMMNRLNGLATRLLARVVGFRRRVRFSKSGLF